MADSLLALKQKIIDHPYFQKSKSVIEKTPCHDYESVYDHLLATATKAEVATKGEFVSDTEAKKDFTKWMKENVHGMRYEEIAILTGLLHDIGKVLVYTENGKQLPLVIKQKNGTTRNLGHEYWGAMIVPKILSDVGLSNEISEYIANIVKLHGTFLYEHFDTSKTINEHISEMKALGQGLEKEILFNTKADVATCAKFDEWLKIISQMFNTKDFYIKREYHVV